MSQSNESITTSALSIKEMATPSGLSEHTLRYYEKVGLIEAIPRDNHSGHRRYSHETALVLETLSCLRTSGLSLAAMREYLRLREHGDEAAAEQRALFEAHANEVAAEINRLSTRQQFLAGKVAYWAARERGDLHEAQRIALANQELAKQLH